MINQAVLSKTVKCIVFTSSIASFGAPPKEWLPMIEETPQHPEDPYGVSKLAVELDLKAAKEMFDMDFVVFRPHNVYGPKQNIADKFRNGEECRRCSCPHHLRVSPCRIGSHVHPLVPLTIQPPTTTTPNR